jgi:hypothetical protein
MIKISEKRCQSPQGRQRIENTTTKDEKKHSDCEQVR